MMVAERRRASYAFLTALFNVLLGSQVLLERRRPEQPPTRPMDFLLLSLATFRLSHLISGEKVLSWIRLPFVQAREELARKGNQEAPVAEEMQVAVAELITCPWCTGMWIAQFLYFGLRLVPGLARPFVSIAAISAVAQVLDAAFDLVHWSSVDVRTRQEKKA